MKENLYIVVPAYNEEKNIKTVIHDYLKIVNKIKNDSKLVIVDDGSKDKTYEIAQKESLKNKNIVVLKKENGGHGSAVLYGYRYAIENNATYVFQVDSDNQTEPEEFWEFWEERKQYDVLIGHRKKREDGFSRYVVTKVLKFLLLFIFGVSVKDANTPFRLMKTKVLAKYIDRFSDTYFLPNIMLSVFFVFYKEKVKFIPISFHERKQGKNSINLKKIVKIGEQNIVSFYQFRKTMFPKKKKTKLWIFLFCFLIAFLAISISSASSPIYVTNVYPDPNAFLTVGRSMLHGMLPYRDLFEQKGPVLYFLYMIASLISSKSFFGVYLLELVTFTVFLYFLSKIIRLYLETRHIFWMLPLISGLLVSSIPFVGGGIPELFMLPLITYSVYKMLENIKKKKFMTSKELFFHGFLCGLIFMMKFTLVGFYFGFMVFVLLKDFLKKRYRQIFADSFTFLLGMSVPFLLCSLYFAYHHALKDFIDVYFGFNLTSYAMGSSNSKIELLSKTLKNILSMTSILGYLSILGMAYFLLHKKRYKKEDKLFLPFVIISGFLFIFINGKKFNYYSFPLYFSSIFGLIAIVLFIEEYYRKIPKKISYGLILLCAIFYVPFLFQSPNCKHLFLTKDSYPPSVFAKIIQEDNPNATVLNYGCLDSGIHNLLGTVPTNRYFMKLNVSDIKYPELMDSQDEIVENKKVDYLIIINFPNYNSAILTKRLQEKAKKNYDLVKSMSQLSEGIYKDYYLYKKKTV